MDDKEDSKIAHDGDVLNVQQKDMSAEFQKHILDTDPLQKAFYKAFCGHREVSVTETKTVLGYSKERKTLKTVIDTDSRMCNESCANMLFNSCYSLIGPTVSTSHVKPKDIYDNWNGLILTVQFDLLDSYFIPQYICMDTEKKREWSEDGTSIIVDKSCTFSTSNKKLLREHQRSIGHVSYTKVQNPYEVNIERYPSIIGKLCTLAVITMKAKEGFTLKELAESFFTSNMVKNGIQPQQARPGLLGGMFGTR